MERERIDFLGMQHPIGGVCIYLSSECVNLVGEFVVHGL